MYILYVQLCICLACPSKWKTVGFKQFTGSDFMSPMAGNVGVHQCTVISFIVQPRPALSVFMYFSILFNTASSAAPKIFRCGKGCWD